MANGFLKHRRKKHKVSGILWIAAVFLLSRGMMWGQTTNGIREEVITVDEFILEATRNNPRIMGELIKIKSARSYEIQAKAIYNALLDFDYHFGYQNPQDVEDTNAGVVEQWADDFGLSISKAFPHFGTKLKAGVSYNQSDTLSYIPDLTTLTVENLTNISTNNLKYILTNTRTYAPQFYIQIQQPLLKNWFGILDRFPIKQAELNRKINDITVDESIEAIISELYEMYFEWFLFYYQYVVFDDNVKNSEILLEQIRKKANYGLAEETDLDQVMMMNIEYKKARDLIAVNLNRVTKKLYHWMKGNMDMPEGVRYIPQDELPLPDIPIGPYSPTNSRTMRILAISKQLLDYQLKKEYNENLPDLNFVFQYSYGNLTSDPDTVFQLSDFNPNYYAGVEFSFPIGENLSRGKIKETKARIKKWVRDVQDFERNYIQGIADLKELITVYETVLEYDKQLIKHASSRVKGEEKKYAQGRSDLYLIIQNKDNLVNYRITYLKDYVEYQKAKLKLLGLLDVLNEAWESEE